MRRFVPHLAFALAAAGIAAALFVVSAVPDIRDEVLWRARTAKQSAPQALSGYLSDCGACLHEDEAQLALDEWHGRAGLVSRLRLERHTGKSRGHEQAVTGSLAPGGAAAFTTGTRVSRWNAATGERDDWTLEGADSHGQPARKPEAAPSLPEITPECCACGTALRVHCAPRRTCIEVR